MITKDSIEAAYCCFHQKWNVYSRSNNARQRDEIEDAIDSYTQQMSQDLYTTIAQGQTDYLRTHATFHNDLASAIERLETMLYASSG